MDLPIGTRLARNLRRRRRGELQEEMVRFFISAMIFVSAIMLSACPPLLNLRFKNETGKPIRIFILDRPQQLLGKDLVSKKMLSPGGNWVLKTNECTYTYNFPSIYNLTKNSEGRTSVFTLVVDTDFVVRLEYPPDWKGEKAPIEGLPAIPETLCASNTAP